MLIYWRWISNLFLFLEKEDWLTLDLMLQLSADAFKPETLSSLEHNLQISRLAVFPEVVTVEEKIDWFKYLQEGSEKYKLPEDDEVTLGASFLQL